MPHHVDVGISFLSVPYIRSICQSLFDFDGELEYDVLDGSRSSRYVYVQCPPPLTGNTSLYPTSTTGLITD